MDHKAWARKRLFNAIGVGDIERVREVLAGAADPNMRDKRGRPMLVRAVRAMIPESGVVDALLEAGADPQATDDNGLTALDHARRRSLRLGPGKDTVSKSKSLDADGNLVLDEAEKAFLEQIREAGGEHGEEAVDIYLQERRKAAVRQFMPRRELRFIIDRLEALQA